MATKILVAEAPGFSPGWKDSQKIKIEEIANHLPEGSDSAVFLAPAAAKDDPSFGALLESGASISCFFFPDGFSPERSARLSFLGSPRSTGVKNALAKGSTVYSETFFQAGQVGERLDPCFRFARSKLSPKRAVDVWGTLQAMLFLGISSLPEQGEKGTGERVDVPLFRSLLSRFEGDAAWRLVYDEEDVRVYRRSE